MKHTILFLFLMIYSLSSIAQSYIPMLADSNKWYVNSDYKYNDPMLDIRGGEQKTDLFFTKGDTIIGQNTYKKLFYITLVQNDFFGNTDHNENYRQGFIREDTVERKVWFFPLDSTKEFLLYDFSLNQGDSFYMHFNACNYFKYVEPFESGYYKVTKKNFYIEFQDPFPDPYFDHYFIYTLKWQEGIGSVAEPLYYYTADNYYRTRNANWFVTKLVCVYKNDKVVYGNAALGKIQYTAIKKPQSITDFSFYYNSSRNQIVLHQQLTSSYQATLYNLQGQAIGQYLIPAGNNCVLDNLPQQPGMYILKINNENQQTFFKYIKN